MRASIENFLHRLEILNRSPRTLERLRYALKEFLRFLEERGVSSPLEVRRAHVESYQAHRKDKLNKYHKRDLPEVQNRHLEAVRLLFRFLKKEGSLSFDPAEDVEYQRAPQRLPLPALSLREVKKVLASVDATSLIGFRDRTLLEVLYSSGIRRGEVKKLQVPDLDLEQGFARIHGKGGKERVVPLGGSACRSLESYLKAVRPHLLRGKKTDTVFLGLTGNPLCDPSLQWMLKKALKKAGLEKKITLHTFRRSCATGMIQNNANLMHVKALLGHERLTTLQRYVDLTLNDLKKAHRKTHPRERENPSS